MQWEGVYHLCGVVVVGVYLTQIHNIGLIIEKKKSNKLKTKDSLKIPDHWFLKVSKSWKTRKAQESITLVEKWWVNAV